MAERISLQAAAITVAQLAPITIKAVVQLHKQMTVSHAALTGWAMDEMLLDEGDCVNPEPLVCVVLDPGRHWRVGRNWPNPSL